MYVIRFDGVWMAWTYFLHEEHQYMLEFISKTASFQLSNYATISDVVILSIYSHYKSHQQYLPTYKYIGSVCVQKKTLKFVFYCRRTDRLTPIYNQLSNLFNSF